MSKQQTIRLWMDAPEWRMALLPEQRKELIEAEDADYASKCGPVTVRYIEPRKKLKKEEAEK